MFVVDDKPSLKKPETSTPSLLEEPKHRHTTLNSIIMLSRVSKIRTTTSRVALVGRHHQQQQQQQHVVALQRFLATSSAPQPKSESSTSIVDFMESLKEFRNGNQDCCMTEEQIKESLESFQNTIREARLSIVDCKEMAPTAMSFVEETKDAADAVDNAFAAYADLLDELRGADMEHQSKYNALRQGICETVKGLRRELGELTTTTNNNDNTTTATTTKESQ
uniref:Uncharacterized protein n=1 Tax=Cyclophora tenuis TaxID=216820 RepID=A0A7S1CWG0_CYCTE|mmetsp:Transcript_1023/g.1867  ORF Transcript_1023/g.1867 Transcript_1023/m.1867 type:complete len:222 (+) Transcript_1023:65-730(+)